MRLTLAFQGGCLWYFSCLEHFHIFAAVTGKPLGELSQNQSMKAATRRSAARMPDHRIYLFKLSTSQGQNLDMSCNIAHRAKGTKNGGQGMRNA